MSHGLRRCGSCCRVSRNARPPGSDGNSLWPPFSSTSTITPETRSSARAIRATILYLVERGSVIIWTGTEADKHVLGEVETGGLFGEMAILNRQPRMANASAGGETQLLEMPASMLRQTINRADPLLVQLINGLMNNLQRAGGAVGDGETQV